MRGFILSLVLLGTCAMDPATVIACDGTEADNLCAYGETFDPRTADCVLAPVT